MHIFSKDKMAIGIRNKPFGTNGILVTAIVPWLLNKQSL